MKSRIMTLLTGCLLLWGGSLTAISAPDDDFNPENPAEPSAIDYCRLTVSADPAEGAFVSGSGRYTVGSGNSVYVSTSANNTQDYTYTFLYWTLNGVKTSYSQDFYFTPVKGNCEFVAHYEKKEVTFDPESPDEPSTSTAKRKYYLYLTSNIEGACSFNMASGNKIKEGTPLDISAYPNQDYKFEGWKKDGVIISTDQYLYFTMPGETTTLEACFSEIPFDPDSPSEPTGNGSNVDNSTRMIMEFAIGDADGYTDKTRVVINEAKSLDYEVGCDASKFVSDAALYQIYSLDTKDTKYSINERPRDNGQVPLGIIVRKTGEVVIAATRLDCSAVLVDKVANTECDLALSTYSFRCDAGTIENRFYIKVPVVITGDANDDGNVDATDIVDIANQKMGKPTSTGKYNEKAADANGDKTVNIADIIKIVNTIMGD